MAMIKATYTYCLSCFFLVTMEAVCLLPIPCMALEPDEILVVANRNAARSVGLAKYYMKKRGIPEDNLVQLWVTDKEWCSREDYEKKVVPRVRRYLKEKDPMRKIRCLVTVYGVPLKVAPQKMTSEEEKELVRLKKRQRSLYKQLKDINEHKEEQTKINNELKSIKKRISFLKKGDQWSSLDSEIALVLERDYPLSGWIPNPYFLGFKDKKLSIEKDNVLMVSRLDGPSDKIVKRIIDDSIVTEKTGLNGTAYFDARWPDPGNKKVSDYAFYDRSIHLAADCLKKGNIMPVVIEDTKELFKPGECPEAALYCGWYRLSRYVDAFVWQPGSVGYHIASGECATLKGNSGVWCKMMLEKGIAATIGPVSEPYVQAFPVPEVFFGFLADGILTLAECYLISTPYLSWKMVLVGDPLYCPFKNSSAKHNPGKPTG